MFGDDVDVVFLKLNNGNLINKCVFVTNDQNNHFSTAMNKHYFVEA